MPGMRLLRVALVLTTLPIVAADRMAELFPKGSMDAWQPVGDGVWAMHNGVLIGQRDLRKAGASKGWFPTQQQYNAWLYTQAWLYTKKDYSEFDLSLDYWLHVGGNGGISIRDTSRAQHAVSTPADFTRTPSKVGYEIQLSNGYPDQFPTGSIYTFVKAPADAARLDDWNTIEIESRKTGIRVKLNGKLVAEHPGDPKRSLTGPIGLQLHDQFSLAMFRNVRIREVGGTTGAGR